MCYVFARLHVTRRVSPSLSLSVGAYECVVFCIIGTHLVAFVDKKKVGYGICGDPSQRQTYPNITFLLLVPLLSLPLQTPLSVSLSHHFLR